MELTRELYNAALQERRDAWKKQRVSIGLYDQFRQLPGVREANPDFSGLPSQMLRGALLCVDRAFVAFFRRCGSGIGHPGFPRFKGPGRVKSLPFDDLRRWRQIVSGGRRVAIPLLGKVKVRLHRPLEGNPRSMRITRDASGHWYVTFACVDVPAKPLEPTGRNVGVDLGLHHFLATSDGDTIPNERHGGRARLWLARANRRVTRRRKGSARRLQAVRWLARAHTHVSNQRRERHITIARALVVRYDKIVVENLNVKGLARSALAGPVHDAGWGSFLHWLRCKAESAGREVVEVDPRGTSQECPECGTVAVKTLSERVHRCDCGLMCDRDVAAARVILGRGLRPRGAAPLVRGRRRSAEPKSVGRDGHQIGHESEERAMRQNHRHKEADHAAR